MRYYEVQCQSGEILQKWESEERTWECKHSWQLVTHLLVWPYQTCAKCGKSEGSTEREQTEGSWWKVFGERIWKEKLNALSKTHIRISKDSQN